MSYRASNGSISGSATQTAVPQTAGSKINASKNDNDARKIFVGGISWETTTNDLRAYFEKYGTVVDVTLKIDTTTGRSRGFGFVLFADESSVDRVVADKNHVLHGKQIDPKRAVAGGTVAANGIARKIFVGGLDPALSEQDIIKHFSQYGNVTQVELPFDKSKNSRRAFGFITFDSEEVVNKICATPKIPFGDKMVDVKKATTKDQQNGLRALRGGGSARGGRGGMGPGGYPTPGYDYNGAYQGGYPGYDAYGMPQPAYGAYGAPPAGAYDGSYGMTQGWAGGYDQSQGYGSAGAGPNPYGGYDYSGGWQGDASAYGKMKRGGGVSTAPGYAAPAGYHPYSR